MKEKVYKEIAKQEAAEREKERKEIELSKLQLELIQKIANEKASLQKQFQDVVNKEQDLIELIKDFHKLENIVIEGIEGNKLKYHA